MEVHHFGVEHVAEAQVRCGEQHQHHQRRRRGRAVAGEDAPVVGPVDHQQQEAGDEHDALAVGVAVEGRRAADGGGWEPPRRDLPVQQVGEHEGGVEADHHGGLEGGSRVQEPGRQGGHDEAAGPPQPQSVEPLEGQHQRRRAERADQHRGGADHEHGLAEERHRQRVHPHRQPEVEDADVAEVGRGQGAVLVVEPVGDQVVREVRLVGLVAEEVDREVLEGPQAGGEVEQQHHRQQQPVAAVQMEARPAVAGRLAVGHGLGIRHPSEYIGRVSRPAAATGGRWPVAPRSPGAGTTPRRSRGGSGCRSPLRRSPPAGPPGPTTGGPG